MAFGLVGPANAQPTFVINVVSYDPAESPEEPFEFIELYNYGLATVYLDGPVLTDEGNQGTGEATLQFPGTQGVTFDHPVAAGEYVVIVGDATGSTLAPDWEFFAGGSDTADLGVPNLVKSAGSGPDMQLANAGDGITLSIGSANGSVIPCTEVIDGVSWESGGTGDMTAMSNAVCSDPAPHPGMTNGTGEVKSLQRCPNGTDTDNSGADFVVADRTPGAANDCSGEVPPVISNLRTTPCFVGASQQATLLCLVIDANADLSTVRAYYKLEAATSFDSLTMSPTANPNEYAAALPGQADQAHVQYYVAAVDGLGNMTRNPSAAPGFLRSYRVGLQSIASLQTSAVSDSCSPSTENGRAVNVVGVVTHLPYEYSDNFFYIQNGTAPNSGIKVFTTADSSFVPDMGDSVRVSGFIDEFRCQTEVVLFADCGTVLGKNRKVQARTLASVADIDNEENESMLVTLAGPIDVGTAFDTTSVGFEFRISVGSDIAYVGGDTFFPDGIGNTIVPEAGMILERVTGVVGSRLTTGTPPRPNPSILLRLEPRRDNDVDREYTDVGEDGELAVAPVFHLGQNEPNPFNPSTVIEFAVPRPGLVALRVYDASGRLVRTLVQRESTAPVRESVIWDGRDDKNRQVPSGVYFYRLEAGEHRATRKMLLLK